MDTDWANLRNAIGTAQVELSSARSQQADVEWLKSQLEETEARLENAEHQRLMDLHQLAQSQIREIELRTALRIIRSSETNHHPIAEAILGSPVDARALRTFGVMVVMRERKRRSWEEADEVVDFILKGNIT